MTLSNTPGAPCWIDLFTTDAEAAAAFYSELFGWTANPPNPDFGGYRMFEHNGAPIAGCMENPGTDPNAGPGAWSVYLECNDAAETVAKANAAGGQVVYDAMPVADLGVQAFVVDPGGAMVGIWQPMAHQGFSTRAVDGAPAWFEVLTKAYDEVVPFYRDVFGWVTTTMSDTAEFRYTTLGEGPGALAGIMDATGLLNEAPSHWQFYIQVAEADETVATANTAGASVLRPVDDSPYGRLAMLADPQGVPFCVIGPNTSS